MELSYTHASRHDYKTHLDANGKTYMIDGGLDYVRCSANGDEIHHCVWDDDPFDKVRKAGRMGYLWNQW